MTGWSRMRSLLGPGGAVVEAACRAFAFVFIHPFGDGNGRIHRLLLHSVLARRDYLPHHIVVPISAVILRHMDQYDQVLEDFSRRVMPLVDYRIDEEGEMTIASAPDDAYRYPDLTPRSSRCRTRRNSSSSSSVSTMADGFRSASAIGSPSFPTKRSSV
jgi:hypothetical protein